MGPIVRPISILALYSLRVIASFIFCGARRRVQHLWRLLGFPRSIVG
jgi:hypothetical protein